MRVLVACEFSGIVRDAFIAAGHDAWSADLIDTERPGPHIKGDVTSILGDGWDMMIAFPPCTYLCRSGARWHAGTIRQVEAAKFAIRLFTAPIPRIAMENPPGFLTSCLNRPDQIIQPWQFGHGETKATCLWLHNLPRLKSTRIVPGRAARVHREPPGPDRWKRRSRTLPGIADAMAGQWGRA